MTKKKQEPEVSESDPAEIKPKARKKKVATEPEIVEAAVSAAEPEAAKARPVKKAAKKVKSALVKKKVAEQTSLFGAAAAIEETPVVAKPKRATKPRKDKGRDLVVDEPSAQEVAEVLHHAADHESAHEKAIEAAEKDEEPAVEIKGPEDRKSVV